MTNIQPTRPRFLSEADCNDLMRRLSRYSHGGGYTGLVVDSQWVGSTRWARNRIVNASDVCDTKVRVLRIINGALCNAELSINGTSDTALVALLRRAERLTQFSTEGPQEELLTRFQPEPYVSPSLFFESTYDLDAGRRTAAAQPVIQAATDTGMWSAGYFQVTARSMGIFTSWGIGLYFPYTWAECSITARDPKGVGSGWAAVDWPDWSKIDVSALSSVALDKCLKSRNPVAVEPGRYETILEPQAVCDFTQNLIGHLSYGNTASQEEWFNKTPWKPGAIGHARLGERVIDERLTLRADPMDPELGFPPWAFQGQTIADLQWTESYHAATWIEQGVLKQLSYGRETFGIFTLGRSEGLPPSGAFRIDVSGPTASVDEMIATTKRGLLVTRFDLMWPVNNVLQSGVTRDGLWLIENGKISKACKNLQFTESILFALNNIEQVGVPRRAFRPPAYDFQPPQPVIVPALKVRDFSFTALVDAI